MATILDKIVNEKRKEIASLYQSVGLDALKRSAKPLSGKPFYQALSQDGLSLIAEVKKASPSKGIIRHDFNPLSIAKAFQQQGARALSVLTEKKHFLGDPDYIQDIKQQVSLPVLRKDFIVDPIQIFESLMIGADAILLIKAILDQDTSQALLSLAKEWGLDVLFEVHNETELTDVLSLDGVDIIGVNNRNLNTFDVDLNTVIALKKSLDKTSKSCLLIAESGYQSPEDLMQIQKENIAGVLIGEGLAKHPTLINYFK